MPKKIEGLREKIIAAAKTRLLTGDYGRFSLREIAKDCEIAVGTIYNYFPDKDTLSAHVIREDWEVFLGKMKEGIQEVSGLKEGIEVICREIADFNSRYSKIWETYQPSNGFSSLYRKGHILLRDQLVLLLKEIFSRLQEEEDEGIVRLLAETCLNAAVRGEEDKKDLFLLVDRLYERRG